MPMLAVTQFQHWMNYSVYEAISCPVISDHEIPQPPSFISHSTSSILVLEIRFNIFVISCVAESHEGLLLDPQIQILGYGADFVKWTVRF
jgi:hypothetical protein